MGGKHPKLQSLPSQGQQKAKTALKIISGVVFRMTRESRFISWATPTLPIFALIAINFIIVYPLFKVGYTSHMGSIESAFISDARFIAQNYPYVSWNPLWYLGFPFHLFYTPLLPYLVATAHKIISPIAVADWYHIIIALFYVLTPVSLYLLVKYLFRRQLIAISAALIYSLLPSFSYLFPEVRAEAAGFNLAPWQLQVVTHRYGDAPHVASLALIPIAALLFLKLLKRPSLPRYIWASLAIAAVALLNLIGFLALVIILAIVLFSEMLVGEPKRKLITGLWCALVSFGLVSFWYNPSFIGASLEFGQAGISMPGIFLTALIGLALLVILFLALYGRGEIQPYFIIGAWALVFLTITALYSQFSISLAPQADHYRYALELNMAGAVLGGVALVSIYDRLRRLAIPWRKLAAVGFLALAAFGIIFGSILSLRSAHDLTNPHPDISQTSEYQATRWLEANLVGDERVYATGSHAFWLNVFSEVPQLRGGTDQGATNPWWEHVTYQINKGADGEIAVLWCRALNIKYIVVNYLDSDVPYNRDYKHPGKFEGLLDPVYQFNPRQTKGDIVYEVPLANNSLAKIVDGNAMRTLSTPESAVDRPALEAYVNIVDVSSRPALVSWHDEDALDIDCTTGDGEVVVVQITEDHGWRATVDGRKVSVGEDPLGFIVIDPGAPGEHHIELRHHDSFGVWSFRAIFIFTLAALGFLIVWRRKAP